MRVRILGTRGNVAASAPRHAKHAGVLVDGRLLLDAGEAGYLDLRPQHVFITHLHPDHAVLASLANAHDATIHVPEPTIALPDAHVVTQAMTIGPYRVTPVPTLHSRNVRSVGYVVAKGRRSFFYSSDMIAIEPRYHKRLRGIEVVITDGSFMRRGGLVRIGRSSGERYGHAGIPDLVEFFGRYAQRIVIGHFGSWFYRDIAASVARIEALGNGVRVVAAYDGLALNV